MSHRSVGFEPRYAAMYVGIGTSDGGRRPSAKGNIAEEETTPLVADKKPSASKTRAWMVFSRHGREFTAVCGACVPTLFNDDATLIRACATTTSSSTDNSSSIGSSLVQSQQTRRQTATAAAITGKTETERTKCKMQFRADSEKAGDVATELGKEHSERSPR